MLIYHFGSRDGLVAAIIDEATARSVDYLDGSPPHAPSGPECFACGGRTSKPPPSCLQPHLRPGRGQRLPRPGALPELGPRQRRRWAAAMRGWFERCGAPRQRVDRITQLVESALLGFHVDLTTETPDESSVRSATSRTRSRRSPASSPPYTPPPPPPSPPPPPATAGARLASARHLRRLRSSRATSTQYRTSAVRSCSPPTQRSRDRRPASPALGLLRGHWMGPVRAIVHIRSPFAGAAERLDSVGGVLAKSCSLCSSQPSMP